MIHLKLLTKVSDLIAEDVIGFGGLFFTDASEAEVADAAKEWFPLPYKNPYDGEMLGVKQEHWTHEGTVLRISKADLKGDESAIFISGTITTRVGCGAFDRRRLSHIDGVIKNLLERRRRVVLFPFVKELPWEKIGIISG